MIEFPRDGQISIQDLKAFIEAKLGEDAVTDKNLKNLFAKMEEHSFQLPNAEVDSQGNSQAFIEPHKMSEVYGGRAPITEEGINYGDHEFKIEFFRNFNTSWLDSKIGDYPVSLFGADDVEEPIYLPLDIKFARVDFTSRHKIVVPFGDEGLFLDDENGDTNLGSWVFNNSSYLNASTFYHPFSSIGSFTVIDVECQSSSSGMHIQFDVEPGERYYFEAYNEDNSRILIGNHVNDSSYADSSASTSKAIYQYYTPSQSTIYISIIPQNSAKLSFSIGLIRTYKYYQHGGLRYPELEIEIHGGIAIDSKRRIPLPRMDENNIGFNDFASGNSEEISDLGASILGVQIGDVLFDEDHINSNENDGGNVYINSEDEVPSTYSGYASMSKKILLSAAILTNIEEFQTYASHQEFTGSIYIPIKTDGSHSAMSNINVKFNKSHNHGIYYNQDESKWCIIDGSFNELQAFATKQVAIDYWQENYNQEGEFYISHDASKLFDWIHAAKSKEFILTYSSINAILTFDRYSSIYSQWINYQSMSKSMAGNIYMYSGSSIVLGVGTLFSYELSAGDVIVIGSSNYIVESISSNGFLYITQPASSTVGPVPANYINVNKNVYPKHTAFPQYGYTNTNLKINPFYNLNISPEQLTQIQYAISKAESIIENSIDINIFFMPLANSSSGGVLAAAKPLHENSTINQIFKNPNYTQIYSQDFGPGQPDFTALSLIDATVDTIQENYIRITKDSSLAGIVRINLGYLNEGFYKIKIATGFSTGNVMLAVKHVASNEIYAHRFLLSFSEGNSFGSQGSLSLFSFQAKTGNNYLELWTTSTKPQEGKVYISSGSNVIYTTTDLSLTLNSGDKILINGQILTISSVSSSSITINSSYPYDVFAGEIYRVSTNSSSLDLYSVQVDKINETYVRDQVQSGVVDIDQIDLNSLSANRILADGNSGLYYIILHELLHALGLSRFYWQKYQLSDDVKHSSYPTQYNGLYGIQKYKEIIQEKIHQLNLSKTLADYYTNSIPAQAGGAHIAEYAKLVNNKVQPSFTNEIMSPEYGFDRAILSKITLGFLEDLGYEVDYSQVESSYLLEMSENTDISNDPNSSNYDQIVSTKKGKRCPHCDH
jgi:hypothetical protein